MSRVEEKKLEFFCRKACMFQKISTFAAVLIKKTCGREQWLQVKGFINFGFWFLKILAFLLGFSCYCHVLPLTSKTAFVMERQGCE